MQHSLTLYRIDPAKNMKRFYRLDIQRDLFGNHCLLRVWGRIGRPGQVRSIPYPTGDEAQVAFQKQRTTKERKGYVA
jgi:predicted DNA-binding WGR domain protein